MKQINLYKYVSKDVNRPYLTGVYHDADEQTAVACDSHILVAYRDAFRPECGTQTIDKAGNPIEVEHAHYPKWKSIIPDEKILRRDYSVLPGEIFLRAVRNAANFKKNIPQTWDYGKRIASNQRTINIVVSVKDREGDTVNIAFRYEYAKQLAELPQEGAEYFFKSSRHAIFFRNESAGVLAVLMPIYDGGYAKVAVANGLHNDNESENKDGEGMYLGTSWIADKATEGSVAERFFREPEKKETGPIAKVIEGKADDCTRAVVHHVPQDSLAPIEGTQTFFRRDVKVDKYSDNKAPHIFKFENGFYVDLGRCPREDKDTTPHVIQFDGLSIRELMEKKRAPSVMCALYFQRARA